MESDRFDRMTRAIAASMTRRRALVPLSALGVAGMVVRSPDADAKKKGKKKKKKCKGGKKKCGKKCIAATSCCTSNDCDAGEACTNGVCGEICVPDCAGKDCGSDGCEASCGSCEADESCQNGTCTPLNPCAGQPDQTPCGEWSPCGSPIGICGDFCSGGVCAQLPTCKESSDPCGANCCDPAGVACANPPMCGCSSVGNPCFSSGDCCGGGACVGWVCQQP